MNIFSVKSTVNDWNLADNCIRWSM